MSEPEKGYDKLASFMEDSPILKKYQRLAVRDLLYLQAELCHLEYEYQSIAKKNEAPTDERRWYALDWVFLEDQHTRGNGGEQARQWAIAIAIREKLREYCMFTSF
jgi:hypothetical protein